MSLAWRIDFDAAARKQARKLPPAVFQRIVVALRGIAALDNPRLRGKAMAGKYGGYWRYRVGDYRVIARIEESRMVILVLTIGHRRDIYR